MIALHESLVEWTVLALGLAVAAALLLRVRQSWRGPLRRPRGWLPCVALLVIVANTGIAVDAAAARSEAAGAWNVWHGSEAWAGVRAAAGSPGPAVAGAAAAATGGLPAATAAAMGQNEERAAAAVRLGAIAALVSLVVLLMAWLYLSRSLCVLPSAAQEDAEELCCADCPECSEAVPAENHGRRRARGLTMTRLGGG
jgi:hypothetical protein